MTEKFLWILISESVAVVTVESILKSIKFINFLYTLILFNDVPFAMQKYLFYRWFISRCLPSGFSKAQLNIEVDFLAFK
jgi:hypothetical protein